MKRTSVCAILTLFAAGLGCLRGDTAATQDFGALDKTVQQAIDPLVKHWSQKDVYEDWNNGFRALKSAVQMKGPGLVGLDVTFVAGGFLLAAAIDQGSCQDTLLLFYQPQSDGLRRIPLAFADLADHNHTGLRSLNVRTVSDGKDRYLALAALVSSCQGNHSAFKAAIFDLRAGAKRIALESSDFRADDLNEDFASFQGSNRVLYLLSCSNDAEPGLSDICTLTMTLKKGAVESSRNCEPEVPSEH